MSKKKKRALMAIGILLLLLITIAVCYFLFTREDTTDLQYDDNATAGILPGVDVDERRKELQNILDRSMIAFSINTSPVFLNGTYIENVKLDKVLEKGTYDATAYFSAYEEESGEYIGRTGAHITLTVQN